VSFPATRAESVTQTTHTSSDRPSIIPKVIDAYPDRPAPFRSRSITHTVIEAHRRPGKLV
jgi:hypothetical protein